MHFVSLKDSPAIDYIEFFRTKFPLAYKKAPEDDEDAAPTLWINKDYEKKFADYETQMAKVFKSKDCVALL